jgi:hypothetical protein
MALRAGVLRRAKCSSGAPEFDTKPPFRAIFGS